MLFGYARVSTLEQNLDLQKDDLEKAGCEEVIVDKVSGTVANRPGLNQLKSVLRKGDTVMVWRLDRLGRSLRDLIEWVNYFDEKEVAFRSLKESLDTATSSGKLVFHIFGALAEFERNLIRERTSAGLAAARARGRLGGAKNKLSEKQSKHLIELYQSKKHPVKDICELFQISKPTLYKYVREASKEKVVGVEI